MAVDAGVCIPELICTFSTHSAKAPTNRARPSPRKSFTFYSIRYPRIRSKASKKASASQPFSSNHMCLAAGMAKSETAPPKVRGAKRKREEFEP